MKQTDFLLEKRRGLMIWEIVLFMVFLAIAAGSSVFFFFLSSKDVRIAQNDIILAQNANVVLDMICDDLSNAVLIERPFDGEAKECYFRKPALGGTLDPSLEVQGFVFSEGGLSYVVRTGSGTSQMKSYRGLANPLISGVDAGKFLRPDSRLIQIQMRTAFPESRDLQRNFRRSVFLRNQ